jgi:transposase
MSRFQLLSDAQWSLIADLLPARTGKQGRPFRDARQVVAAHYLPVSVWDRVA